MNLSPTKPSPILLPVLAAALLAVAGGFEHARCQSSPGDDQFLITADEVEAEETPRGRVVRLESNVTITRRGATLRGSRGIYYEGEGRAVVFGDVTGTDEGRSIACDTLRYFLDDDVAFLTGNASYSDSSGTTAADRIHMLRRENVAVCRGGVRSVSADAKTELTSDRLVYDFDTGEGRASVEPVIRTYDDDGELDSSLAAEVIEYSADEDEMRAFGSVVIEREDIVARSRAASLSRGGSITLEGDPVVERGEEGLDGDRILITIRDGEVSRVVSTGGATATYTVDPERPGGEPSRGTVSGDTLTMFMEEREPVLTTVRGHSASDHFVGETGERNVVSSRAIDVLFTDGEISRVAFRGEASGTYYFLPEEEAAPGEPEESGEPGESGEPAGADTTGGGTEPLETEGAVLDTTAPAVGAAADSTGAPVESAATAGDTVGLDSVAYQSEKINYYVARNRIALSGRAQVDYQATVLYADEVMFDPEEQVLEAYGNPDLRERSDRLIGARLHYDLEEKTGAVDGGVTTFEDGLYYGEKIHRAGDGTLRVRGGTYTTCSDPEPHYRLVSHKMKIYLDDKVVARPIILYLGNVPVMALPFYVFPIGKERSSGFLLPQIELGISEGEGRFVRNFGYYWAASDYWDASFWADYYEQTKWIVNLESRYKLRYVLSGRVQTSFMQQLLYDKRRWDLKFNHRQEFGRVWTAGASGDFRSDATYASDSNQSIQEIVNRSLHSQVWVRGRWSSLSAGVTLDRREQLDAGVIDLLLPKAEVSATQQPVLSQDVEAPAYAAWLKKVSYSWSARLVNDRNRSDEGTVIHQGVGLKGSLRSSEKLFGWLNLSPRASFAQNWYDRDKEGRKLPARLTYDASISARTTVYGTFFPMTMGVSAVRHIVEPAATFSWTPEFSEYFDESGVDRFYSFSGFGSTPRSRRSLGLSLVNKLQAKLGSGETERRIDNLLRLSTATAYDFKKDEKQWSDLVTGLEVRPGGALSMRWNARHAAYGGALQQSSVTATLDLRGSPPLVSAEPWEERVVESDSPAEQLRRELQAQSVESLPGGRAWDASVTFRYSRGADPSNASYWVDGGLAFSPARHWRFNYSLHYDLEQTEVASQEYTIYRDLHCWEAQFTRRYYEGEWQYYFRISVKALPEIQAQAGKKYLERSIR